jgi:hypothetical protein
MGKKIEIDGPAGRQEVSDKYRSNYDAIFSKKSKKDGGKNNGKSSS